MLKQAHSTVRLLFHFQDFNRLTSIAKRLRKPWQGILFFFALTVTTLTKYSSAVLQTPIKTCFRDTLLRDMYQGFARALSM